MTKESDDLDKFLEYALEEYKSVQEQKKVAKLKQKKAIQASCDICMNYNYDEEYGYYICEANLDEDDMSRFVRGHYKDCPYFRFGDEYTIVKKQM